MKITQLIVGMFVGAVISAGLLVMIFSNSVTKAKQIITERMYYNCVEVFFDKEKCAIASFGIDDNARWRGREEIQDFSTPEI